MDSALSKTQIDKLGERLRIGKVSADDLRLLDDYRRSFSQSYEQVVGVIRNQLAYEPTGRPAKSTPAIREKLLRESIRLSQIQDIAGCRVVVGDLSAQDSAVARMVLAFPNVSIVNRRLNPSYGYRAIHLIVDCADKLVEVQCRSELQHLWSQLSEGLADVFDPALKYGRGPRKWRMLLDRSSELIANLENSDSGITTSGNWVSRDNLRQELTSLLSDTVHWVSNLKDE